MWVYSKEHDFSVVQEKYVEICKKIPSCFPKWLCHFHPLFKSEEFQLLHISSPAFDAVGVLDFGPSNNQVVVSYCFNLHFPVDVWYGASFYMLICHLYIFFMTNLDSILKSRDITLSTKVHQVKAMVFPEASVLWHSA